MSTVAATPAASTFNSPRAMMDDLLAGPIEPTQVIEQEAPPIDPDNPEPEAATSEIPEDEPLDEETEVPPAEDDEEDESLESIKDGKKYRVNSTKMKRLLEASKIVKAASEHFDPTPEAIESHYKDATVLRHMAADFKTADPQSMNDFLHHWSLESPEALAAMAQAVPAFLARNGMNSPLRAIETQVQNALVSRAYSEVAQIAATPAAERSKSDAAKLYRAQTLDYAVNGSYKKDAEIQQMAQQPQRPQIDQREQRLNQQEKNLHDTHWNNFDTNYVTGPRESILTTALDEAFKPFDGKYSDKVLKSLKASARTDVQEAISKRAEWKRNQDIELSDIQREFRQALKTNKRTDLEPRITAVNSEYRNFISRQIPGVVKALTPGATKAVVADSQATHDRLARGARQTAPGAGGTAAPRSIKGQNYKEALDRVFA